MNRAERRQKEREEQKLQEAYRRGERNRATAADLQTMLDTGFSRGFREAGWPIIKSCYAGICIMLHDEFGFGQKRCFKAIEQLDKKIVLAMCNQDLADETLAKAGISLNLDDVFERVSEREADA